MFQIYKKPGQKLKLIISGNKYNEKLSEKLTHTNKIQKTAINKIFSVKDKLENKNKFYDQFKKLIYYMDAQNIKDLNKVIKNIVKN
jgi:FlaA1/EpsC-like NDP-sugar epimerase